MKTVEQILKSIKPEVDFSLSQDGLLDSLELITLIEDLESTYDIEIDPMEILPENFSSVSKIMEMIVKCGGTLAQ